MTTTPKLKTGIQKRVNEAWQASPAAMANHLSEGRWMRAKHLNILSDWLVEAALHKRPRILVQMPPRSGKSELTSHWFPLWYLHHFPRNRIIFAGYAASFAADWGRKVRNSVTEYGSKLNVKLSEDSTKVEDWHTIHGGGMLSAGVDGPITGKGADILIVDDPIKSMEDALSKTVRDKVWDWWQSTAYTRMEPNGCLIIVMTRWHTDDLVGRILQQGKDGGEKWDVLNLPAIAEDSDMLGRARGEALWPERYDLEALGRIKSAVGSRVWGSLYQQAPSPEGGGMFQKAWWKFWRRKDEPEIPSLASRTVILPDSFDDKLTSWDLTFKNTTGSDLVAGGAWGISGSGRYLLDMVWKRLDFIETLAAFRRFHPEILLKLVEDKANGPAVISMLQKEVPGIVAINPKGSKEARAIAITPFVEAGNIYLPLHAWWRDNFIDEASAFPNGAHDDAVDMMTQALDRWMHRKASAPKPQLTASQKMDEQWQREADALEAQDREEREWQNHILEMDHDEF